jgi:type II secretory pathway pseudopilin PulG
MRHLRSTTPNQPRQAFSLVEIALALAILAVALVSLLALMPAGVGNHQKAMDLTITSQIGQAILAEAQQTEFSDLVDLRGLPPDPEGKGICPADFTFRGPIVRQPAWRYFDAEGIELHAVSGKLSTHDRQRLVYQVNTRIRPRAYIPGTSHPSNSIAQVTVQVIRNPALKQLPIEVRPDSVDCNLVPSTVGMPTFTFSAHIGRNDGQ